jgi:hypothetical protein
MGMAASRPTDPPQNHADLCASCRFVDHAHPAHAGHESDDHARHAQHGNTDQFEGRDSRSERRIGGFKIGHPSAGEAGNEAEQQHAPDIEQ